MQLNLLKKFFTIFEISFAMIDVAPPKLQQKLKMISQLLIPAD
jgi:hypothetical protein